MVWKEIFSKGVKVKKNNLQRQVYFNGNFVDESEARVSIYDSALMFGDMVFEMTRSFNGNSLNSRSIWKDYIPESKY